MKNKILVIFFISFLFSSIIYKFTLSNNKYILILGDNYFKSSYNKDYIYFLKEKYRNVNNLLTEENDTYENIINKIKKNYKISLKKNNIYLNQEISKADHIIISANNKEFNEKCNKYVNVKNKYIKKVDSNITELIYLINKISTSKIIIMDSSCTKENKSYNYINIKSEQKYKNELSLKENHELYGKIINEIED